MRRTTHRETTGMVVGTKRKVAMLSVATLVSAFGAASGCGVQEGQEKIDKARQVEKQVEDSQRGLEKQLQEGQEN